MKNWTIEQQSDICLLTLDKLDSGQNVLSSHVLQELEAIFAEIEALKPSGVIVRSGKSGRFIAGADVREFTQVETTEQALEFTAQGHRIFDRIASAPFPVVAMINGHCLGGGLELALACHYRVVCDDPTIRLGLPEVLLGIHPGLGGTVRLIEKAGVTDAMDLILSGRGVVAKVAKKMGFVDLIVPERQLRRGANYLIAGHLSGKNTKKKSSFKARLSKGFKSGLSTAPGRALLANVLEKKVSARAAKSHYPAPYAVIDLWKEHGGDRKAMLAAEQVSATNLVTTKTSQNLVKVFFLQEELKGLGKSAGDLSFEHVHVIGAGVMGGDIASWCALRGLHVTIQDQSPDALARAVKRAYDLFKRKLRNPRLVQRAMDRFQPDLAGAGVKRADVIIEAIFENAEAKINLFSSLEKAAKPEAILASNTSSIPLETICNGLSKPGRLVGLHFFNPVAKMQLVEVVNGEKTYATVSKQATAFATQISKLPLPVKSSPGFLVNRILMPYVMEAVEMFKEGVPKEVIDKAAKKFGMPMGPIVMADTVGLDICKNVAENLSADSAVVFPKSLHDKIDAGKLGKKTGEGFYVWKKGKPIKDKVDKDYAAPNDLEDRLVFRYLNETVACIYEGIVERPHLADGGLIFGTGFPPFRGGPLNYIVDQGQNELLAKLEALHQKHGDRFAPSEGWSKLNLAEIMTQ